MTYGMKIPIILLNGPPGSGKDTAATIIQDWLSNHDLESQIARFSSPIKRAFAGFIGAPEVDELGESLAHARDKESPIPILSNHSYREWQIEFSEHFIKTFCGPDTFADILAEEIYHAERSALAGRVWIISDCGFQSEVDRLATHFDPNAIALFRLRRPGHTFANDSRNFVEPKGGFFFSEIPNNAAIEEFKWNIDRMMRTFLTYVRNPEELHYTKPSPAPLSASPSQPSQTGPCSHSGGSALLSRIPPESESS
jgi:hypothetical protein